MRNYILLPVILFFSILIISFNKPILGKQSSSKQPFTLCSKEFENNGQFPKLYTCDSLGISPALYWKNTPKGTKYFALTMHHISPKLERHVYFILYDIPENISEIPMNVTGIGHFGQNTINDRNEYAPPCSKGPGPKLYVLTAYALSSKPDFKNNLYDIDLDKFHEAIKDNIIDSSVLNVYYSRQPKS